MGKAELMLGVSDEEKLTGIEVNLDIHDGMIAIPFHVRVREGAYIMDSRPPKFNLWLGLRFLYADIKLRIKKKINGVKNYFKSLFYLNTTQFIQYRKYEWLFDYKKGKFVKVKK